MSDVLERMTRKLNSTLEIEWRGEKFPFKIRSLTQEMLITAYGSSLSVFGDINAGADMPQNELLEQGQKVLISMVDILILGVIDPPLSREAKEGTLTPQDLGEANMAILAEAIFKESGLSFRAAPQGAPVGNPDLVVRPSALAASGS